ncbi:hypothetical protein [Methylorubrum sp. SB2]|uniref:hypothetical protein n=1 Tax=Methylorubrum subtropicum TaxID=3138812 RepID=UPI00313DD861
MPTFEIHSRVTRRSLMNRTKDVLASCVLELHDVLDREQARREAAEARALAAESALVGLTPDGSEFYRRNPDRAAEREYLADVPACVAYLRDARERMCKSLGEAGARQVKAAAELREERARHAADAEALRAVIQHLRPGAAIVRVDEPTTGRHRYELWTNLTPKPAEHAAFLASVRGMPWTSEPKPTRDADLPQVGSFHG